MAFQWFPIVVYHHFIFHLVGQKFYVIVFESFGKFCVLRIGKKFSHMLPVAEHLDEIHKVIAHFLIRGVFNPRTFDEAGELVNYLNQGHSLVMTLEGLPTDNARRLLDFLSGITFALQGKITPVSAKTYFVTPQNVDILGPQTEQPESDGQYF